ncbi:serine/threonine-protein kinase [Desulfitispora alkaliphila]|uniref:protein kinase domain-containing protein n=1 Tax=Desulfitispora alkaliphila TaxID=622674 RepID=UPI003D1FC528
MIKAGSIVRGAWHQNSYRLCNLLGEGGFAKVYMTESEKGKQLALKISRNAYSIQNEYKALQRLNRNPRLKQLEALPIVYEKDDATFDNDLFSFFTLDIVKGVSLQEMLENGNGLSGEVLLATIKCLLEVLDCLHMEGLALGDIKPGNFIYDTESDKVVLIDLGGVTPFGQEICEYTPLFDRENWCAGCRIAGVDYDLFSLFIFMYFIATKDIALKPHLGIDNLLKGQVYKKLSSSNPVLAQLVEKGLRNRFSSLEEINESIDKIIAYSCRKRILN